MTFEQLECFFEVARCRNFSRAAERLFMSQPTLTKAISKLEGELGVRLFDRSTHHCQLTEEGSMFFRKTEDLFFQLNSCIEDTRLSGRNRYRTISIGISPGEPPIPSFLDLLRTRNQTSTTHRFVMLEHTYIDLIEMLENRELDANSAMGLLLSLLAPADDPLGHQPRRGHDCYGGDHRNRRHRQKDGPESRPGVQQAHRRREEEDGHDVQEEAAGLLNVRHHHGLGHEGQEHEDDAVDAGRDGQGDQVI